MTGWFPVEPSVLPREDLTDRELEVLDLVATGLSNAAVAGRLHLSDKTVRNVVSTVLGKVGARDRAEAVLLAREAGLGRP